MNIYKYVILFFFITFCSTNEYYNEINTWKEQRLNALKAKDGYLNLAGLFHLDSGRYSLGSNEKNNFILPDDFPGNFANITIKDSIISFSYLQDSILFNGSEYVMTKSYNVNIKTNKFSWKHFEWFLHREPGVFALRLRDLNHPMNNDYLHLDYFLTDPKWIVNAKYYPYDSVKVRKSINVLGNIFEETVPGILRFIINNDSFLLEPTQTKTNKFFIVFSDFTSSNETYSGGRFIYTLLPNENRDVIIDFNKSYNPPCVFSSFTTCPLPPSINQLKLRIEAGEKMYKGLSYSSIYE